MGVCLAAQGAALMPGAWAEIRRLRPSPRVQRLHAALSAQQAHGPARLLTAPDEVAARNAALLAAYRRTAGQPPVRRRAAALQAFADGCLIQAGADDLLLGSLAFNLPLWACPETDAELRALGYAGTTGHIVHDYAALLGAGTAGLRARVDEARRQRADEAGAVVLAAFGDALSAFRRFVERHAAAARAQAAQGDGAAAAEWRVRAAAVQRIAAAPPARFAEALQLLWFAHLFLHAENPSVAISFGRLDQILWPFLERDLATAETSLAAAFDLLCAFLLRCCAGEESQNAVVGGTDAAGRDAANPLTLLLLQAMRSLRTVQPSLTVRLHPHTPADVWQAACELAAAGTGNPGFMNDAVVVPALMAAGVPEARARDWAVVGCYEAVPQGDCYPNTVLGRLHLVEVLAAYLRSAAAQQAADGEQFYRGLLAAVGERYRTGTLPACEAAWERLSACAPSPFGSCLLQDCIGRGLPLEGGGARITLAGINVLGLGTVVDSLVSVHELVFRHHACTLAELAQAAADDFPDEGFRRRLLGCPGRYGTDAAASNAWAARLSADVAHLVLGQRCAGGRVQPYPGFFAFGGDIHASDMASADGRRRGDWISYGISQSTATATTPTTLLRSAAHVAQGLAACGCPLALALPVSDLRGPAGTARLGELVRTYFALGGSHLHVNAVTAAELREAQAAPEAHASLVVRVSGYSARFVTVDRRWQDALVARAEAGL